MTKDRARIKAALYVKWAEIAEVKAKTIYENWNSTYKDFDWTQPILRGHHSQKRHEKVYERRNSMYTKVRELEEKAKRFREKAENLLRFANTNKGDAEKKRQLRREMADASISVGSKIYDVCYGSGVVKKVNKKTYTICFDKFGSTFTRDKSFISI